MRTIDELLVTSSVLTSRLAKSLEEVRHDWEAGKRVEVLAGVAACVIATSILQENFAEAIRYMKEQTIQERSNDEKDLPTLPVLEV